MRSWQSKLILPPEYYEQEKAQQETNPEYKLWPKCQKCSKDAGHNVTVTAYGVKDTGKLTGTDGEHYTDFYAKCHGEEDIIRIEGLRWDKMADHFNDGSSDYVACLAAILALPFFHTGSEMGRNISASVFKNFLASQRGSSL